MSIGSVHVYNTWIMFRDLITIIPYTTPSKPSNELEVFFQKFPIKKHNSAPPLDVGLLHGWKHHPNLPKFLGSTATNHQYVPKARAPETNQKKTHILSDDLVTLLKACVKNWYWMFGELVNDPNFGFCSIQRHCERLQCWAVFGYHNWKYCFERCHDLGGLQLNFKGFKFISYRDAPGGISEIRTCQNCTSMAHEACLSVCSLGAWTFSQILNTQNSTETPFQMHHSKRHECPKVQGPPRSQKGSIHQSCGSHCQPEPFQMPSVGCFCYHPTPTGATGFTIHQLETITNHWLKKTSESKNLKKKLHQYPWKFVQALLKFHLSNQVMPCQEIVLLWSGFEVLHLQCHLLSHPDPRKNQPNIDDFNERLWLDT